MRVSLTALLLVPTLATAQTVTSVYNRDTHEPFRLKKVKVASTVIGPMVRTSTWLTYANPYKVPTEATLNFELAEAAALGGFAYRYGDEYVRGQLIDKAKAWAIYTAITSRGRDPGIMEQWSPTTYHCQIYPIKRGRDLRVRLWTVGMLQPREGKMALPQPKVPKAVGYEVKDGTVARPEWRVRTVRSAPARKVGDGYVVDAAGPVDAVVQRFKDGRTYVAGVLREEKAPAASKIVVDRAVYESPDGSRGADVTAKANEMVAGGETAFRVQNAPFGDPAPGVVKQLRIDYKVDGVSRQQTVPENALIDLRNPSSLEVEGLEEPKLVRLDGQTVAFCGWVPKGRALSANVGGRSVPVYPRPVPPGGDAARLWAQQMLATKAVPVADTLAFSVKYGVPSVATALLAVPAAEMKAYQAREAEARRRDLAAKRQNRSWADRQNQNWTSSGGGDPEIRVTIPNARAVEAILPDRRVIPLRATGDVWGGNFEIPAATPEGTYRVRILAHLRDGTTVERAWTYEVDRTPPKGRATLALGVLTVGSEPGLVEVAAYGPDGARWTLREESPGVYRGRVPVVEMTVVLKDRAGNKGEAALTNPPQK